MDHVIGVREIEPYATGTYRQDQIGNISFALKLFHDPVALCDRDASMNNTTPAMEDLGKIVIQIIRQFTELGEDQDALTLFIDRFRQLTQHLKFSALGRTVFLQTKILIRVITDLFKMKQQREDDTTSLDAFGMFDLILCVGKQFSVQDGLLFGKSVMSSL